MQTGQFDKAVNALSELLRRSDVEGCAAASPACHCSLLLARSAAYARLSEQLRSIPAAQSEHSAICAPDPCQLAALATQDAEAALRLQPGCPVALLHKGNGLCLQEQYREAEAAYRAGLLAQPTHAQLLQRLRELQESGQICRAASDVSDVSATRGTVRKAPRLDEEQDDDMDCSICSRLLYEPVTTPCGHTFCRSCFARSMDHSSRCPLCRTVLHVGSQLPVTRTLATLLEKCHPEEYKARREEEQLAAPSETAACPLPLFVMSLLLPGQTVALNIFEPRYRLLCRRAMSGNRRLGMAALDHNHELCEVACEAEITECHPQVDGRFYIEVVGRRRFKPTEVWEQDGYRVARPEYVTDEVPAADTEEAEALQAVAAEVEGLADAWLQRLRTLSRGHRGIADLVLRAGAKPASHDVEALSFWVARLVCPLLDRGEPGLVRKLMLMRCTQERLQTVKEVLQQLSRCQPSQCSIM